ncbi:MAG: hypothetical protein ACE5KD_00605 [Candidatus Bathyarchaeia archaeon]
MTFGLTLAIFYALLQFAMYGVELSILSKFVVSLIIAMPMAYIFAETGKRFETWEAVATGVVTVLVVEFIFVALAGLTAFSIELIFATLINSLIAGVLLGATGKEFSDLV